MVRVEGRLTVECEHLGTTTTAVTVRGELDLYTAPFLRAALVDLVQHGHTHLFLDLSDVPSCDSTGVGVLVGALKRTRARDGTVRLVTPSASVLSSLRITGLWKVFAVFDSLSAAEESVITEASAARPVPRKPPARQSA
nr:STAS domain-containing protein [Streptomyces boluensis]